MLALATGCGPVVVGSGRVVEEQRPVSPWRTLSVASGIRAEVVRGAPGVTITTDDNLQPEVEAFVDGSTLVVRVKPLLDVSSRTGITARVSGDRLEGVAASGGSSVTGAATSTTDFHVDASGGSAVTLTGLDTTELSVDASGASTVTVSGVAATLRASASGASSVDGRGLPVQSASIDGSGASTLHLNVASTITGSLSGASRLTWTGGATANVSTSGGSTAMRSN
ncbi:MAG: DUF2807 domain-containing protein [Myxococcota bacterium]